MLLELFIFFEAITIGLFIASFFTKQEILWAVTLLTSGFMMMSSYTIEKSLYVWNTTSSSYDPVVQSFTYPYLTAINMVFFGLGVILLIYDLFDKYGTKVLRKDDDD